MTAKTIEITPLRAPLRGAVSPPGSKSITNRALVCAALAQGTSTLTGALDSDDTRLMIAALQALGIGVAVEEGGQKLIVSGSGGEWPKCEAELFVGNSGTTVRFLTAMVASGRGRYRLDGTPRMRQRPIGDLLDALRRLGVDAESETGNGCPPVIVRAAGLAGGAATLRGDVSSQFLSALLMAAPYARGPLAIHIDGPLVSQPYVQMTLAVMRSFGATVGTDGLSRFVVSAPRPYQAIAYAIEPDASAAGYFWGAAAITGGRVTVRGLSRQSLQGDVAFCDCLAKMGCQVIEEPEGVTVVGGPLTGIDVDMNAISDTAPTLSVAALFAAGPTVIRGVAHIRHKETDRLAAVATELRKLGAQVEELPDGLKIVPGSPTAAAIDTYDDHRMAMSFALAGLRIPGVVIRDPDCTAKTYPRFFDDLAALVAGS